MKVENINTLSHKGLVSNELLILISNLTLEQLIAIKIELSASELNNKLYGIPIWKTMPYITREALLKVTHSICSSYAEGCRFLGLDQETYKKHLLSYGIIEGKKK
jgi:hypothetical protein